MKIIRVLNLAALISGILAIILIMSACSGSSTTSSSTSTSTSTSTSSSTSTSTTTTSASTSTTTVSGPSIKITSPGSGNQFGIGKTLITVEVSNFNLVNKLGQPKSTGEGHIFFYMDVDPPVIQGQPASTTPGTCAATTNTSYTWNNVGGGQHKFSVELVNNDYTPLNPPVISSTSILVIPEIGPPAAVILSPRDGAVVKGNSITVEAQAVNFNLINKLGQTNTQREGHIHFFIDVDAPTVQGQPAVTSSGTYAAIPDSSYTWVNVAPGVHTLSIELVNNDHTPLDPPVVSKILITVMEATTTTISSSTTTTNGY